MSVNPYEEADRLSVEGAGSREVESWALLELAKRLDRVRREHEQQENTSALSEIVRLNWRAWTVIQSSLLDESNPISPELRGNLLTLCAFIDKHSTQLLSSPDASKVQILIDINMHLGQGLRGEHLNDAEQKVIMQAYAKKISEETNETNETAQNEADEKSGEASALSATEPVISQPVVAESVVAPQPVAANKDVRKEVKTGIAVDF